MPVTPPKKTWTPSEAELGLQSVAQRRADEARQRVSPDRLSRTISEYIEWEAFAFWVRAIVEAEGSMPSGIAGILDQRCPGFSEYEQNYRRQHSHERPFVWLRLVGWIRESVFRKAEREGWLDAVLFDAFRDPRYKRLSSYWQHSSQRWSRQRPTTYPAFEEWRDAAERHDPDG